MLTRTQARCAFGSFLVGPEVKLQEWFDWTLVDIDVAINSFMWQNGGHSGPDHWEFVLHPAALLFTIESLPECCDELARLLDDAIVVLCSSSGSRRRSRRHLNLSHVVYVLCQVRALDAIRRGSY